MSLSQILGIHLGLGAIGVWIAMVFDWLCRVSFYTWRFLSRKWLNYGSDNKIMLFTIAVIL